MDDVTEHPANPTNLETDTRLTEEEVNQLYEETLLDSNEAIEFAPGKWIFYLL